MGNLNLLVAFLAGLVSFLAPCVLPLIPGYLAYLAGSNLQEAAQNRRQIFINSLFFVLGFALVFAALGVLLNTLLEAVAFSALEWLSRIGGLIIIFFGIYLTGIIKIPFLQKEYKPHIDKQFNSRYLTSAVFGAAFAAGWTPCVGAALGAILGLAAAQPGSAFSLLLAYAIGLGVPFLLIGLFAAQAKTWISKIGPYLKYVNIIFGIILIGFGILIFTQTLNRIANFELLNQILK